MPRILVLDKLAKGSLQMPCGDPAHIDQGYYLCFNEGRNNREFRQS